jgi:hypothetical protein
MGKKIKNANEAYQNYIFQCRYNGNVLGELMKVSHGILGFRGTQMECQCLRVKDMSWPRDKHEAPGSSRELLVFL